MGLVDLLELKRELRSWIGMKLSSKERREALMDPHSRREPRMCGLTVHPAKGCSFGCKYCYIEDMGFSGAPRVSKLNGLQLAYALLSNPHVLPSEGGTLLAFGSVTEPFLPGVRERTLEYLRVVRGVLRNPVQISTKSYLSQEDASELAEADPDLSVLVTIPALGYASRVEPFAPKPELRFRTIENLAKKSLHVSVFLRPLIPGVAEEDGPRILELARGSGARGVVLGTLRVTPKILERMRGAEIHLEDLLSDKNLRSGRQVPIDASPIKSSLRRISTKLGLRVFPAACSANMDAHSLGCHACDLGPCQGDLPPVDTHDLEEGLRLCGIEAKVVRADEELRVIVKGGVKKERVARSLVRAASRRKVSSGRFKGLQSP
ncbi:MAG: radical SAM protein [Candidatus Korarchaeum sp.]